MVRVEAGPSGLESTTPSMGSRRWDRSLHAFDVIMNIAPSLFGAFSSSDRVLA